MKSNLVLFFEIAKVVEIMDEDHKARFIEQQLLNNFFDSNFHFFNLPFISFNFARTILKSVET